MLTGNFWVQQIAHTFDDD